MTRRRIWRIGLRLAALGTVLALAGALAFGFLGRMHPALDSFAHFRIHLAALLIAGAIPLVVLRFHAEALLAVLLGTATIWATTGSLSAQSAFKAGMSSELDAASMPVFRLMHLNLRFDNQEPERVLSAIGRHRPDVITLAEVSDMWRQRLLALQASYPHQIICPAPAHAGGVAILSRRPFAAEPEDCGYRGSYAHAEVDFAGRTASIVTLHLGWPWPFGQPRHLSRIEDELFEVSDTAILGGDFNAAPWSYTVRRVAELGGFHIIRGLGPTWLHHRLPSSWKPWIGLPIDQMLVKGGVVVGSANALPDVGSDHLPLLLEFSLLPQNKPAAVLQASVGPRGD